MKKLQNNYTNHEQGKRLLELGVPADSADLLQVQDAITIDDYIMVRNEDESICDIIKNNQCVKPCWSVGRLMEIYGICSGQYTHNMWLQDALTCILADIEFAVYYGNIDFSKLED